MQLHQHRTEIEETGAQLHLIGNGGPSFIDGFRETTGYTGSIYTDPSLKVYEAAGLIRSVVATFSLGSIRHGAKSFRHGLRQGKRQGDAWQQGGALVLASSGELLWSYQSTAGGDNVSASELLGALARTDTP